MEQLTLAEEGIERLPAGRPPRIKHEAEFAARARAYLERPGGGWDKLEQLADNPGRDQLRALELMMAYGYGRPRQQVAIESTSGPVVLVLKTAEDGTLLPTPEPEPRNEPDVIEGTLVTSVLIPRMDIKPATLIWKEGDPVELSNDDS